ncbi:DNRLRE domain-containing protein [Paenibacillus sp. N1-5-1-14]|uniref:DNRLRE domain-containing protein n=1 Tax=Paenibacillus radicibacter TaxID=2972488 RepID=UPI002158B52A|nr:DNRLRE domain-containing protein [Paenibacillus radicibacter]MCR8641570.1 DNRLRE domain-containing protein [Paenibacillus radicibacter]
MTGKFNVIGVDKSNLTSSISVKKHNNIYGNLKIYSDFVIVDPSFPPTLGNQRRGTMNVLYRNDLSSSIQISPKNRMVGIVDVALKPKYTVKLFPVKDAFVRESVPTLNYGSEQSMLVGYNPSFPERYRSFLEFDLNQLPKDITVIESKLNLYSYNVKQPHQIGLFSSVEKWTERGVTWATQPNSGALLDIQTSGSEVGLLTFDASEKVRQWHNNEEDNNGFTLKAMNETVPRQLQFYTRESVDNQPYLEITYEENVVYSSGRSELESKLFVSYKDKKEITARIFIPSQNDKFNFDARIHVFNPNYYMESSIKTNKPFIGSKLKIRQSDSSKIDSNLIVRQKQISEINNKIGINYPSLVSRLFIPYSNTIESKLTVRKTKWSDTPSSLRVNRRETRATIKIPYRSNIPSDITIRKGFDQKLTSKITVNRRNVLGKISIIAKSDKEINGNLFVMGNKKTEVNSSIFINRREVSGHIDVVLSNKIESTLTVRRTENTEIPSNIFVPYRDNIKGSLEVTYADMIIGNLYIISGYLRSNIIIPAYETADIRGRLTVRVKWINDIRSTINIDSDNIEGGYVLII